MDEQQDFTLADFAEIDISEVQEIRYESLPAGVYGFKIASATMDEKPNRDQEQRFICEVTLEVVEVKGVVKKGVDLETLVGKTHKEKYYVVPEKALEGIGRIRAAFTDMGVEIVQGQSISVLLDSAVGHTFYAKIRSKPNPNDPGNPYAALQLTPAKK